MNCVFFTPGQERLLEMRSFFIAAPYRHLLQQCTIVADFVDVFFRCCFFCFYRFYILCFVPSDGRMPHYMKQRRNFVVVQFHCHDSQSLFHSSFWLNSHQSYKITHLKLLDQFSSSKIRFLLFSPVKTSKRKKFHHVSIQTPHHKSFLFFTNSRILKQYTQTFSTKSTTNTKSRRHFTNPFQRNRATPPKEQTNKTIYTKYETHSKFFQ